MRPIFLIGYMGSGKSTLGRALSMATGMQLIDLDTYIENRYRMNVSDIFRAYGEEVFRSRERTMLHEVADFEDVIVACGGGTPCFFDNMAHMNSHGTTVLLDASRACLFNRLKIGRRRRPLIAAMTDAELERHIASSLSARMPFYSMASASFPSDALEDATQIRESVRTFAQMFNLPLLSTEYEQ
ncbi:MAG: shikimate kinase [Muribaculaceae bacterium]|nr:shikimate kinase [Muribaculaceae bacterium]